jgi:tRNA(fMet)-specific endonuclease VapC
MRRYLLDTGVVVAVLRGSPGATALCIPWIQQDEAATSIVVYGEAFEFFRGLPGGEEHRRGLRRLLRSVYPQTLNYAILERYGEIRRALRPRNQLIGDLDTLIAATALAHDQAVVTTDRDYQRVPGLAVRLLTHADLR